MGWASGISAGTNMANNWIKTYRDANIRRGLEKLGPEADVVSGDILKVGDDQMVIERGAMGIGPDGAPVTPEQAYKQHYQTQLRGVNDPRTGAEYAEPSVSQGGIGYAARAGSYDQGVYEKTEDAQRGADRYNYGLMRKQADVYRRYGEDDMARTLSRDARMGEREDARFGMEKERLEDQLATSKVSRESMQQQLDLRKTEVEAAKRMQNFETARQQLPNPNDFDAVAALATKYLSPDQQLSFGTTALGLNKLDVERTVMHIDKVIRGTNGSLASLAEAFKNDPQLDPGSYFDFAPGPKGGVVVQFKDAQGKPTGPATAYGSEMEAFETLVQQAKNPGNVLKWTAEIDKLRSETTKNYAHAGLYRRTDPNRSGGGGGGGLGTLPIQNFNTKDFVAQLDIMGVPAKIDPATGQPVYTEQHRALLAATQHAMAVKGLPMHSAIQEALRYVPPPGGAGGAGGGATGGNEPSLNPKGFRATGDAPNVTRPAPSRRVITEEDYGNWARENQTGLNRLRSGSYMYRNRKTGELISESEFDARLK